MPHDNIYAHKKNSITPFEFNQDVVDVFDDMIERSVPYYRDNLTHLVALAQQFYQPQTAVYELGASTGNLALALAKGLAPHLSELIAVDSSPAMTKLLSKRLQENNLSSVTVVESKIQNLFFKQASLFFLNYTLQFLPLDERDAVLQKIYHSLLPGGVLFVSEKITDGDKQLARTAVDMHAAFKKANGYSDLEVSQKREALENVLITETLDQHKQRLEKIGFQKIAVWSQWFNFVSFYCVKS